MRQVRSYRGPRFVTDSSQQLGGRKPPMILLRRWPRGFKIASHPHHPQVPSQLPAMKLSLLAFLPAVLALPAAESSGLASRQTAVATTDSYIFSLTLPQFTVRRNNRNPASLDWSSDGCSNSPDNPFGFPFTPACHRHDFGYRNFKKQSRFTDANRKRIDDKFNADLLYQCSSNGHGAVCRALADVYYAAVRAFGGSGTTKREEEEDWVKIYEEKLAIYNELVKAAQATGELWTLD
ncbi:prokaryotic phospholipase A2-domain-containing protein [Cercophora samala]|uniref:Prokaryotic phospholipase A2-domain-containing protein n=1 Tax=Cercophora samala TaxID=330535 RepID=A0AA39ZIN2_9PEZI|nr:prokaryotic phospholipase A2-domain-containing protein [Cercophora samala]